MEHLQMHMTALIAYGQAHNLKLVRCTEEELYLDDEEWEDWAAMLFDPFTLREMTPLAPVGLHKDGTFSVVTGEDSTGDVCEDFDLMTFQGFVREGQRVHMVSE